MTTTIRHWTPLAMLVALYAVFAIFMVGCATSPEAGQVADDAKISMSEEQANHNLTYTTQCESESDTGCVWVADEQGNGQGESFWTDEYGALTSYLTHDDARTLLDSGDPFSVMPYRIVEG